MLTRIDIRQKVLIRIPLITSCPCKSQNKIWLLCFIMFLVLSFCNFVTYICKVYVCVCAALNIWCTHTRFDCRIQESLSPPPHFPTSRCSHCAKRSAHQGASFCVKEKSALALHDGDCFNVVNYFEGGDTQLSHMTYRFISCAAHGFFVNHAEP